MTLIDRRFREKIVLVGVVSWPRTVDEVEASLDELSLLVDTAGADEVARIIQRRDAPDPATYIGRGKAEELRQVSEEVDADTVVFDEELTPAQQRNLERLLGRTAIDRTAVILDIFAQNAHTEEGRAQVELALSQYRLPRLRGRGVALSQQAGRIGTRGPGETKLEEDRRRIMRRIRKLEEELRELEATRLTQQRSRRRGALRTVSLVGYTNAGKSTLLNRLTDAGVLVENRLFSTLDPRTRRLELPGGETVLMTDTVGFVRKLPHQLVDAFHATLDVVTAADLLLHIVDGSARDPDAQIDAVRSVLSEIGAADVPELLAINKADLAADQAAKLSAAHDGAPTFSALTGEGVPELLRRVADRLRAEDRVVELAVPVGRGDVVAAIHREGEVVGEEYEGETVKVHARLDERGARRFAEFVRR
ncbi:MAG TPA: GTPase HflX [Acidimicrobiales bacterium]|nr:GTPase HflX [Acidimicrobiales bacterium]